MNSTLSLVELLPTLRRALALVDKDPKLAEEMRNILSNRISKYLIASELWAMCEHSDSFTQPLLCRMGFAKPAALLDNREAFILLSRMPSLQTIADDVG